MYSCTVSTVSRKAWEVTVRHCKVCKLISLFHGILSPSGIGALLGGLHVTLTGADLYGCCYLGGGCWVQGQICGPSWAVVTPAVSVPQNCVPGFAVLASSQCHYLRGQHLLHKCLRNKRPGYCEQCLRGKAPKTRQPHSLLRVPFSELRHLLDPADHLRI